jgi:hypothetical protein
MFIPIDASHMLYGHLWLKCLSCNDGQF